MSSSSRKFRPGAAIAAVIIAAGAVYWGKVRPRVKPAEGVSWVQRESLSVQSFETSHAVAWIRKQVEAGPRIPGTASHKKVGDELLAALKLAGAEVREQRFSAPVYVLADLVSRPMPSPKAVESRNLIGSFRPESRDRILLAAHWDSRALADKDRAAPHKPVPGAIDGASGVGILMEIARLAGKMGAGAVGVDIIFFDNEDQGISGMGALPQGFRPDLTWCLGSQFWQEHPHVPGYRAKFGVLLDMVGARGAEFPREGNSLIYAREWTDQIWKSAASLGHSRYFVEREAPPIVDDHLAVNRYGIPMVDIIDMRGTGFDLFPTYHHTLEDSLSAVDPEVVRAVGQTVLQVLLTKF